MRQTFRFLCILFTALFSAALGADDVSTQPVYHIDTFDTGQRRWDIRFAARAGRRPKTVWHESREEGFVLGKGAEHIRLQSQTGEQSVRLELPVPPARVIPDLTVRLAMRSSRPGAQLGLQVVFPNETDPSTGRTLRVLIPGESYGLSGEWDELKCKTSPKSYNDAMRRIRNRTRRRNIDTSGAYVDAVMLFADIRSGITDFTIDRVEFGPIVPAKRVSSDEFEPDLEKLVKFRVGQVFVHDRPFFPLFTRHVNEDPQSLTELHLNSVWLTDRDADYLEELRQLNMWAILAPFHADSEATSLLDGSSPDGTPTNQNPIQLTSANSANNAPLIRGIDPILCWYMGTQLKRGDQPALIERTRATTSRSNGISRPFMADVAENERKMSRHVDMIGVSRHLIGTSLSFRQFRELLRQRRNLALAGSFVWTWIQTEAVPGQRLWREEVGRNPVVIEPEQIRLQVYSALSAGCRALGYWKSDSFHIDDPGAEERQLVISQLNMEIRLLEEWLASGHLDGHIEFEIDTGEPKQPPVPANPIGRGRGRNAPRTQFPNLMTLTGVQKKKKPKNPNLDLEAAVIRSKDGMLLLPVYYERDAQFVPGPGSAPAIRFVAPPFAQDAVAWAVTTTGLRPLKRKSVSGGIEIVLPDFDLTAAVIVTTNRRVVAELKERARRLAPKSASVSFGLAQAKLDRVRNIERQLQEMAPHVPPSSSALSNAERTLVAAEQALQRQDYAGCVRHSQSTMRILRQLQRAHWDMAIAGLSSPLTSPHTTCFNTLPDHWSVQSQVEKQPDATGDNLLEGGAFESESAMTNWGHRQEKIPDINAGAELYEASQGNFCLRLLARPERGKDPPEFIARSPVTMTSAPVNIQAGQILEITGLVRVPYRIHGSLDGAMIYDSIGGKASALRWNKTEGWERFRFLREVPYDGAFRINFVLDGLGSMQIDDVQVRSHGFVHLPVLVEQGNREYDMNEGREADSEFVVPGTGRRDNSDSIRVEELAPPVINPRNQRSSLSEPERSLKTEPAPVIQPSTRGPTANRVRRENRS